MFINKNHGCTVEACTTAAIDNQRLRESTKVLVSCVSCPPTSNFRTMPLPLPHLLFLLLSSLSIILLFHLITIRLRQRKTSSANSKLPPAPPSLPLLGHLHRLGRLPHRSLQKLSSIHGPIMLLHLGHVPTVILSSASAVEEAIRLHDLALSNRPRSINSDILAYNSSSVPFTQYGEHWRQARRVYAVHMLSVKQVESFRQLRQEEVSLLVDRIRRDGSSGEKAIDLSKLLIDLTNSIACR
jgi:Cytochrome P450